jgi:4,5-DOPA dioxygenase extradiol
MNMSLQPSMPVLFAGHGSPMNAIEDNAFTRGWQAAVASMPKPKAILCISAHWETRGVGVCIAERPQTIHDFGGFPQALFDVQYPAPGDPALARRVASMVKGVQVHTTPEWGLDHGAWSVLRVMYPQADVPVVQLSLDTAQPGAFHLNLARELTPLRDEGVLILGSGNIVHNLRLINFRDPAPADWAMWTPWPIGVLSAQMSRSASRRRNTTCRCCTRLARGVTATKSIFSTTRSPVRCRCCR